MDLRVALLLIAELFIKVFAAGENATRQITCFDCETHQPRCKRTCVGSYCYKLKRKDATDRGCVDILDGASIDKCEIKSSEQSELSQTPEIICICSTDRCNPAADKNISTALLLLTASATTLLLMSR